MRNTLQRGVKGSAILLLLASLSACLQGGRELAQQADTVLDGPKIKAADSVLGQCAMNSSLRAMRAGLDAPGRVDIAPLSALPQPDTATLNMQSCMGNQQFRIGASIQDMTGPAADSVSAGYETPTHVLKGIHLRQFARAFAIESPCNGERVAMVVTETGFMTTGTRQTVLDLIAADPELAPYFGPQNVMLAATHTHSGPGGEAHHEAYNLFRLGYDDLVHQIYTQAIYQSIREAFFNLQAQQEPGRIRLQLAELLDANINRSMPAFLNNPQEEREQWLNARGEQVTTGKRMMQLRFERADGTPIGLYNWFPVHTTSVGTHEPLISSDNKGLAAIGFEALMRESDFSDGEHFVAAFAQAGHGDTSPNLCFGEYPYPDVRIGCGEDTLHSNAAHGVKQLARAVEMFDEAGSLLKGGIRSRLFHVPMDDIEITDPVVLQSLRHPAELDEPIKRTCTAALGFSMAAGAEDNPGVTQAGITCGNINVLDGLQRDLDVLLNTVAGGVSGYPALPASTLGTVVGCGLTGVTSLLPGLPDADYSCHAEKPILFPVGTTEFISNSALPLQIFALGNFAVVGLPWEVTTTAARRIRHTVQQELRGAGVEYVVVASMTNDFVQYLTTREEYATQQYEGGSTHFGPWTLAAVQQEVRKLSISLRDGLPPPEGVELGRSTPTLLRRLPYIAGDVRPFGRDFGDVLSDAKQDYASAETVQVRFVGAHPRNDTQEKLNDSYLFAERKLADGSWQIVAEDRLPQLIMRWHGTPEIPLINQVLPGRQSEVEAIWHLPANLAAGIYRLRYSATAVPVFGQAGAGQRLPFEGVSREFSVAEPSSVCPEYPAWF